VAAWAYLLGWKVVCQLPQRWAEWAFRQVADWVWWRRGPGTRQLEANLARVTQMAHRARPDAPAIDLRQLFVADLDPDRLAQRQGAADGAAHQGPPATPGRGQPGGRLAR
jgi:hypothetical protein